MGHEINHFPARGCTSQHTVAVTPLAAERLLGYSPLPASSFLSSPNAHRYFSGLSVKSLMVSPWFGAARVKLSVFLPFTSEISTGLLSCHVPIV